MKLNISEIRKSEPKIILVGNYPPIIQSILDFDFLLGRTEPSIVGIVGTNKKSERFFWGKEEFMVPFFREIEDDPNGINSKINYFLSVTSARRVLSTTEKTLDTLKNLKGGVIFGENTPEIHSLEIHKKVAAKDIFVIGPSSVGLLVPGHLKLGAIGGVEPRQLYNPILYNRGSIALFSASGGMTNELINIVASTGKRISFCMSFGGDRFPVTTPKDAIIAAENDPATEQIIYFGELGGTDEYEIADLMVQGKVKKPFISYIGGSISAYFPTPPQFGHAKALAKNLEETAKAKSDTLNKAGAKAAYSFSEFVKSIKNLHGSSKKDIFIINQEKMDIHERKKALFASSISHETPGGVEILGEDLQTMGKSKSFAYIVASMLLGKKIKSKEMEEFTNLTLKSLLDNGPSVSGAVNTIVAARAGKDLVSSLAAGLLTIGKRFGGAVNGAAQNWLSGTVSGNTAKEFVENASQEGRYIEGIGHKKYRIDNPDPRVKELAAWADKNLKSKKYLIFALSVEKVTTTKKANLILNVDGTMAAIFLDILSEKEGYTEKDLKRLTEVEFFNAFFVIPRSIGFVAHYFDQVRLDEGLFRLPVSEIARVQN